MELNLNYQCACANCGHIIEYLSSDAGKIIKCPKCGDQSQLPEVEKLALQRPHGPSAPEFRRCEICGAQVKTFAAVCSSCEARRKQETFRLRLKIALCAVLVLAVASGLAVWQFKKSRKEAAEAAAQAAKNAPRIFLAQPKVVLPKSTNDLQPGRFYLEKARGSDLMTAVGDIQNISQNVHLRLRADVDLLDYKGVKIGAVSDYCTELTPNQSWHFLAAVTNAGAMSVRFAGMTEDQ